MRPGKIGYWLCLLFVLRFATGCSYLKSLFPDKERDYQFRTEIPELIVPNDLQGQNMPQYAPTQAAAASSGPAIQPATESLAPQPANPATSARADVAPEQEKAAVDAQAPQSAANKADVSSLQIDQPKSQAWRLVARALSRQKVEIVERNQDKGYFYVRYDPNATPTEDKTFWNELDFIFGRDPSHEQEYRVSLLEIAPQTTEVTIQNDEGQTLSNNLATHLLKLITDGITLDLPAATPENPAPENPAP
ncbi:MAG: outer membrane protein assembly factor BamC [Methylococcales bacterium]|nr:outer membrane protein assembly factor BamC [Methylococcales bacterium]